jgi:hypothetical protein
MIKDRLPMILRKKAPGGLALFSALLFLLFSPMSFATSTKTALEDEPLVMPNPGALNKAKKFDPQLRQLKYQNWYDRLNTYIWVGNEIRNIGIDRLSTITDLDSERFSGDYNAQILAATVGGNLLQKTSFHVDLTLTRLSLDGQHLAVEEEYVEFQRNKTLFEVFVDHQLLENLTIGADLYYGGDYYRNANSDSNERIYDEEMGGGLSVTSWFDIYDDEVTFKYIYSKRKVNPGASDDLNRSFHSVLTNLHHEWNYNLSSDVNLRWSYYPTINEYNYWESRKIWSIGTELNYRFENNGEVSLNLNHLSYGENSFTNTLSVFYRYRFGNVSSKRRQRGQKIPRLLIK